MEVADVDFEPSTILVREKKRSPQAADHPAGVH